ncbi:MAG: recombinase family protein [Bacteriovoracaceae bacterium]|nr:recombinase family protein [Bacteriovoracaceae bacterium]
MDTPKSIKAVAYARVSTLLNQDPENQLVSIRQLGQARGYDLIEEYVDRGVSGSKDRRAALDEMVKAARAGKFKILIIYSIDRLARDTRHLLNLINDLSHFGVSLISLREALDFSTPLGQATLTILGAVAQLEKELIRERIRTALAAKKIIAQQNKTNWRCGRPTVVTDQIEKRVHELRAKGHSIRAIARILQISKSSVERALKSLSQNGGEI